MNTTDRLVQMPVSFLDATTHALKVVNARALASVDTMVRSGSHTSEDAKQVVWRVIRNRTPFKFWNPMVYLPIAIQLEIRQDMQSLQSVFVSFAKHFTETIVLTDKAAQGLVLATGCNGHAEIERLRVEDFLFHCADALVLKKSSDEFMFTVHQILFESIVHVLRFSPKQPVAPEPQEKDGADKLKRVRMRIIPHTVPDSVINPSVRSVFSDRQPSEVEPSEARLAQPTVASRASSVSVKPVCISSVAAPSGSSESRSSAVTAVTSANASTTGTATPTHNSNVVDVVLTKSQAARESILQNLKPTVSFVSAASSAAAAPSPSPSPSPAQPPAHLFNSVAAASTMSAPPRLTGVAVRAPLSPVISDDQSDLSSVSEDEQGQEEQDEQPGAEPGAEPADNKVDDADTDTDTDQEPDHTGNTILSSASSKRTAADITGNSVISSSILASFSGGGCADWLAE